MGSSSGPATLKICRTVGSGSWNKPNAIPAKPRTAGGQIYFDMYDSSGLIRNAVLPHVTIYAKNFLLREPDAYARSHYGGRTFTEYYHESAGVQDSEPQFSDAIASASDRAKLRVGWNMAFAHHGPINFRVASLYRLLPIKWLLDAPTRFYSPSRERPVDATCRVATSYARETVAYQRVRMCDLMKNRAATGRVPRAKYYRELTRSKVVLSPFGWGEHAMRDYETFICGAVLLKPDMSYLDTYPPLYDDGQTMVVHNWDLEDVGEKLDQILSNHSAHVEIAKTAQDRFR